MGCVTEISSPPCISVISLLPLGKMSAFSSSGVEQTEQAGHTVPCISEDTKALRSEEQRWRADAEQTQVFLRLQYISFSIRHLSYDCFVFSQGGRLLCSELYVVYHDRLMNSKACTITTTYSSGEETVGVGVMTLQCTTSCVVHLRLKYLSASVSRSQDSSFRGSIASWSVCWWCSLCYYWSLIE